jgi:hypothetical protein
MSKELPDLEGHLCTICGDFITNRDGIYFCACTYITFERYEEQGYAPLAWTCEKDILTTARASENGQELFETLTRLERAASMNRCWDIYDHEDFCEGFPEAADWAHGDVDEELCQALEQAENLLKEIRGEA